MNYDFAIFKIDFSEVDPVVRTGCRSNHVVWSPTLRLRSRHIKVPDSLNEKSLSRYSGPYRDTAMSSKENHTSSKKRCGMKPIPLVIMKDIDSHFLGVLGATGAVGTRFILLLAQHPLLELVAVGASENSADKKYSDVVHWKQSIPMPAQVANLIVRRCVPIEYTDCDIIFSGLNSDVAGDVEMAFLKANFAVFSNAKNFRLAPLVPLIVPVVNLGHIESILTQRRYYQIDKGLLVCNSNCAVIGLVIPAAALIQRFGPIDQVSMVTMQAVSGAGYPGVSSK